METSLLRKEEIGTLNNILEMGLPLRVNQGSHVRDVDRFRAVHWRPSEVDGTEQMDKLTVHHKARRGPL